MTLPQWADVKLSQALPALRAAGESQTVEFKEAFPAQAHDLAREIAAFASIGGGTILLGVNNGGEAVGLDLKNDTERDQAALRAQGILRAVRPAVKAEFLLAVDGTSTILAIVIGAQDSPVFYYEYRPYVRDGRLSRPAEPHEVVELVLASPSADYKKQMEALQIEAQKSQMDIVRQTRERFAGTSRRVEDSLLGGH